MAVLDDNPKTGFGIVGRAKAPFLILRFAQPLRTSAKSTLVVRIHQDSDHRKATIGRFRVALSSGTYSWADNGAARKTDVAKNTKPTDDKKATPDTPAPAPDIASAPDKTSNEKSLNERKEKLEASDAAAADTGAPPKQGLPSNLVRALERPEDKRSPEQVALVRDYFEYSSPALFPARLEITKLETNQSFLKGAVAEVMITESVKPRETRILPRGNWMDDSGAIVEPAIPDSSEARHRRPPRHAARPGELAGFAQQSAHRRASS